MIYHRGGEPEQTMHCWFNVVVHKPWIKAEFVTVCCSVSVVSKTSCSHFFGQWSYYGYTHALTKLWSFSLVLVELNFSRLWVSIMHGLTWILCVICTVCEQPALVCHGLQLPCVLTWVVFVPWASFMSTLHSGSSPSPMRQRAGPIACTKLRSVFMKYLHTLI